MKTKSAFFLLTFFVLLQARSYAVVSALAGTTLENSDILYKYNLLDINTYVANSGFLSTTPIQLLWDGGTAEGVNDSKATGETEAWVEFDFGKEEEIAEARLWQDNGGNRVTHWKVMAWTGSGWTDIFPYVVSNTAGWQSSTFDVKATKVRFCAKCATNGYVSIHEIELFTKPSSEQRKVVVGCIGDSNTYGAGASVRVQYAWPVQLCKILGLDYKVNNLGVSGTTLQSAPADKPWIATTQYTKLKDQNPDVAIIALGTNDSKSYNWPVTAPEHFKTNYVELIKEISAYSSKPEVCILMPIKAFSGNYNINNAVIENEIRPIIREISKTYGIALIDGYSATENIGSLVPDGIHPNDEGLNIIAQKVASVLQARKPLITINGPVAGSGYSEYRWYKDGTLIDGATSSSYMALQAGIYKVAVKLNPTTDDIIVSKEIEVLESNVNLVVSGNIMSDAVFPVVSAVLISQVGNNILVKQMAGSEFDLFDTCGRKLKSIAISTDYDKIDLSGLPQGTYLYNAGNLRGKIIK